MKLPGSFGDDALCVVEVTSTAGRATGLHTDPSNETFYVLEGELLFHVDGREYPAPAGQTITVRSGVPHAFVVVSPVARFLVMNTPGTQERFFRAGGEPATHRDLDAAPPPDLERTMAAAREFGVDFLGPPPFAPMRARGQRREGLADRRGCASCAAACAVVALGAGEQERRHERDRGRAEAPTSRCARRRRPRGPTPRRRAAASAMPAPSWFSSTTASTAVPSEPPTRWMHVEHRRRARHLRALRASRRPRPSPASS